MLCTDKISIHPYYYSNFKQKNITVVRVLITLNWISVSINVSFVETYVWLNASVKELIKKKIKMKNVPTMMIALFFVYSATVFLLFFFVFDHFLWKQKNFIIHTCVVMVIPQHVSHICCSFFSFFILSSSMIIFERDRYLNDVLRIWWMNLTSYFINGFIVFIIIQQQQQKLLYQDTL